MAKSRVQKEVSLQALTSGFRDAVSVAFADYRGLTVVQADELRKKMRASDVRYHVAKKTLVTRAAKDAGLELNAKQFDGMLGVAFGISDEISPAKIFGDMSKTTTLKIVGGVFQGVVASKDQMIALSMLPSRLELLGTVVGTMYAPVSAFARVLNAIREARESGAPASPESPKAQEEVVTAPEVVSEQPVAESAPEAPVEAPAEVVEPPTV